jgi:hypothetical protein
MTFAAALAVQYVSAKKLLVVDGCDWDFGSEFGELKLNFKASLNELVHSHFDST